MEIRLIRFFIIMGLTMVLALGCAGSRDDGEGVSDEEQQQKELDDIEALLGIASPEADKKPEPKKDTNQNDAEKLDFLENTDRINMTQPEPISPEKQKELENKISQLEKQVRQKDMTIADLNSKLAVQAEELKNKPKAYSGGSSTTIVSDISIEEYQSRYDDARSEFENRNYQAAITLFESLMSASTNHSLSDNAQYWIGECHYALGKYDAAIIDFEKVFTFPKSNKLDDAQYKLGLCYVRKGDSIKAKEELNRLINNYPNSEYVARAENLIAQN